MTKWADLIERDLKTLVALESLDNGKSLMMATLDVQGVADCIRYYAGWADKIEGKVIDTMPDHFNYTRSEPVCVDFAPES